MIHDAYECVLESIGFGFADLIRNENFFLPIVHAESDYLQRLFVGDKITVAIKVGHIGETSFAFEYEIRNQRKQLVGTAKTVHVTIHPKTQKKTPLPSNLRRALEKFQKS